MGLAHEAAYAADLRFQFHKVLQSTKGARNARFKLVVQFNRELGGSLKKRGLQRSKLSPQQGCFACHFCFLAARGSQGTYGRTATLRRSREKNFLRRLAPISRQQDDGRQWCGYRLVRDASKDTTARIKVGYAFSSIFLPPGRSIAQRMPPLSPALNRPEGLRPERTLVFGSIFTFTTRKRTYRLSADLQPGALK